MYFGSHWSTPLSLDFVINGLAVNECSLCMHVILRLVIRCCKKIGPTTLYVLET